MDLWRESLLADMRHEAELASGEPLESIFFGGGTPSLMPPELVGTLLAEAEHLWGFAPNIEITLEANPSSVEASKFADIALAGVNRVSLGLQALDNDTLRFLGRLHDAEEGIAALATAQEHFNRVSFDLIYARPAQTAREWSKELERALAFGTGHLSLYQLTIEPGTRFATDVRRGEFDPLADDPAADLFAVTAEMTAKAGLPAYEVSNHAKPGQESRHNLTYWRYGDYCGIGPGAHGRRGGRATIRHKKPENWLAAIEARSHGINEDRQLGTREQASEAILMGLRLAEGVDLDRLGQRVGLAPDFLINAKRLNFFADIGLAWQNGDTVGVTPEGMPVLNSLLAELVPAALVEV